MCLCHVALLCSAYDVRRHCVGSSFIACLICASLRARVTGPSLSFWLAVFQTCSFTLCVSLSSSPVVVSLSGARFPRFSYAAAGLYAVLIRARVHIPFVLDERLTEVMAIVSLFQACFRLLPAHNVAR